jgi:hypothetical protein
LFDAVARNDAANDDAPVDWGHERSRFIREGKEE